MFYKKVLPAYLLLLFLTKLVGLGQLNPPAETTRWMVTESSSLSVNGSTNINTFTCDIPNYNQTDTLIVYKGKCVKGVVLSGSINLNIQSFDCHNSIMTHDLRKTLNDKQFPQLHISFLTLNKLPQISTQPEMITGMVDIELAGTRKRMEVNYQISEDAKKTIHLLGSRDINFSDFNLTPPRKLGGMIKTDDKLKVAFHLKMRAMN
ncbi:YceI family protein [Mucilaginibacter paludis]|uniref:YceI family protein n=1 Tax=Mucilaginibacter paludis DSM 18603 TaxID=714943 RepID=H1YC12_9SPHI|nr:YceI family protein [Mucilaginibacter paludis]EHQ27090.1 hypothetical protein Mucpa_2983 [Mucilaginibacter paludis DSM 18603]